jgi:predicted dehydrogenase
MAKDQRSHPTRRQVLKGVAAAAVAGPSVVPSQALGLAGVLSPSERINVGLIGCGLIANMHLRNLLGRDDRVQLRAVADVKKPQREQFQKQINNHYGDQYKDCAAYNEYEKILERDDIDAVVIATPDHWHAIMAIRAMERGKDVYCQKPLTLTVREARAVADTARRFGTVFQTGSQQRSDFAFRKAAEIVRNGWVGKIHTIETQLGQFPPQRELPSKTAPETIDYDRWLGPAPWEPYHPVRVKGDYAGGWRIFRDYSGRKNTDWGAHHFDIVQWALGMDDSGPVQFIPPGHNGYEVQAHRYEGGPIVKRQSPDRGMIKFIGEEGTVWCARGNFLKTDPPHLAQQPLGPSDTRLYRSDNHHDNWLQCIRSRSQPICPAEVGARSAMVGQLNNIARQVDRPIEWDPDHEVIKGDPAARRLLDRPDRAPYRL